MTDYIYTYEDLNFDSMAEIQENEKYLIEIAKWCEDEDEAGWDDEEMVMWD